jgi:[acyl-carrier-protein] S-malonyltransferase
MQPAQDALAADFKSLTFRDPAFPVVANVNASFVASATAARQTLIDQVTGAVRWVDCIHLLIAQGVTHYIEVGPGKVLSGLLHKIDHNLHADHVSDTASLEKTLGATAVS